MHLFFSFLVFSSILLTSLFAVASPKVEADMHFAEGLRYYSDNDFEQASSELEKSYNAEKRQNTLFAWAQAERRLGNCEHAKDLLTKYIGNGVNRKQSQAAYSIMQDCVEAFRANSQKEPKSVNSVQERIEQKELIPRTRQDKNNSLELTAPRPAKTSVIEDTASSPLYKNWLGMSLIGSGAIGLGVGGFFYLKALDLNEQSGVEGLKLDEHLSLRESAENNRRTAVIATVVGGALVSTGILYYILRDPNNNRGSEDNFSFVISKEITAFSYGGAF